MKHKPLIVLLLSSACALSSKDCKCSEKKYNIWKTIEPHWHQFRDAFSVHVEELVIEMVQTIVSDKIRVEETTLDGDDAKTMRKAVKDKRKSMQKQLVGVEEIRKSFSDHDMKAFGHEERETFDQYTAETNGLIEKWSKALEGSISGLVEKFCDFVLLAYAIFGNIFIGAYSIIRDKFFGLAIDLSNFMGQVDKPEEIQSVGDIVRGMGFTEDHFGYILNNEFAEGDDIADLVPQLIWPQIKDWVDLGTLDYGSAFAEHASWLTTNSFTPNQAIMMLAQYMGVEAFVGQLLWWFNPATWLGLTIRATAQAVNLVLKTKRCEDYFKIIYDRLLGFLFTQIGFGAELQTFGGELKKCPWLPAFSIRSQTSITGDYFYSVFNAQGVWFGTEVTDTPAKWLEPKNAEKSSWKVLTKAIEAAGKATEGDKKCVDATKEQNAEATKAADKQRAADHCHAVEKKAAEGSINASWTTPGTKASGSGCPAEEELKTTKNSIDEFFQCQVIQHKFDKRTKSEAHNGMKTTLKEACDELEQANAMICTMIRSEEKEAATKFIESVEKGDKPGAVLKKINALEAGTKKLLGYDIWLATRGFHQALQERKTAVADFKSTWQDKVGPEAKEGTNSGQATKAATAILKQLIDDMYKARQAIETAQAAKQNTTSAVMYQLAVVPLDVRIVDGKKPIGKLVAQIEEQVAGLEKAFKPGVANFKQPLWSLVKAFNKAIEDLEKTENKMFTAIFDNAARSKQRLHNIAKEQAEWMDKNKDSLKALAGQSFDVFDFITYGPAGLQVQEDAPAQTKPGKTTGSWTSWFGFSRVRAKRPARHAVRKLLRTIVRAGAGRGQQADKKTAVAARVRSNKPLKKIMNKLLRNLLHRGTAKS